MMNLFSVALFSAFIMTYGIDAIYIETGNHVEDQDLDFGGRDLMGRKPTRADRIINAWWKQDARALQKMADLTEDLIYFETFSPPDTSKLGVKGEYTKRLKRRFRKATKFFEESGIVLGKIDFGGAHGTFFKSEKFWADLPYSNPGDVILPIMESITRRYNNPFLSMQLGGYPGEIVIGDGFLMLLEDLGLEKFGPDFLVAYEVGRQVTHRLEQENITAAFTSMYDPEQDLLQHALAGYYLAHPRGADFNKRKLREVYRTAKSLHFRSNRFLTNDVLNLPWEDDFYWNGYATADFFADPDCALAEFVLSKRQKLCATVWGATLALNFGKNRALSGSKSPIVDIESLVKRFYIDLQPIFDADKSTCPNPF